MNDGNGGDDDGDGTTGTTTRAAENEPERQKLRSCEPDLKITIGRDTETVVHWHHAAIIANHSKYVDTMLANPMKESQTNHVSFPDITPRTWDSMLRFLEDPTEGRLMTAKDVMGVAKYYDKYDFTKGRHLCTQVLVEYFQKTAENEAEEPPDLDTIVDAVVLASEANLVKAKEKGMNYLWAKLTSVETPYGCTMFTEAHMKKLVPLLLDETWNYPSFSWSGWHWKKDEISSPDFPRLFVISSENWLMQRILENALSCINLSGSTCKADGDYVPVLDRGGLGFDSSDDRTCVWGGVEVNFAIERKVDIERKGVDNWVIVRETLPEIDEDGEADYDSIVSTICWESPCSENLPLPPQKNWRPVDPLAQGSPEIKYIFE